ncbi:GNAT family N-acetyltransferase [Enteractinococcus fodinae]|uniref:GNAT family N-acetyltransferase n=1 Tax=Enteractinococcus fodinae TaxID=684663 RepID=UPI00286BED83|nr:GNAT family N-acetyltransferase [Enteractinococcus fodinae]
MVSVTIRALRPDEGELLLRATVDNFNWQDERFTASDVLASPEMVYYTELFPERGDFGFVALEGDTPVGVAWALYLPPSAPGWGFVDAEIPEVSLWVAPSYRREGIGRALIHAIQHGARFRDLPGLSLSVDAGNPAKELYRSEGFVEVEGKESHGVMLWRRT